MKRFGFELGGDFFFIETPGAKKNAPAFSE
jgi:hypothetical protein